jgi:hypothetical protein
MAPETMALVIIAVSNHHRRLDKVATLELVAMTYTW